MSKGWYTKSMKFIRRFWPYLLLAVLVIGNIFVWAERQPIADWWRLRNYTPSSDVATLATDDTMTSKAKHLLYINHPVLESKAAFNMHCTDKGEETAVLGCYHGDRQGIYLYAVSDARLNGVRQVTAAHEMLHQAYDRLSTKERQRIDKLLQDYYANGLTDDAVKSKLDAYKKSDADLNNEMHSIFGTEVRDLPAALETYYKQYFSNRVKVVEYRESYQGEFTRRKDLVAQYDAQLAGLKDRINANKATLVTTLSDLKAKEKDIDKDVAAQDQPQYSADLNAYNNMVRAYNGLLNTTRSLIEQYNGIVTQRNDIEVQERQLQQALDSRIGDTQEQQ